MIIFALVIFFCISFLFKKYFSYSEDQAGQVLSRIVLYITLPATVFYSASGTQTVSQSFLFPLVAIFIQLSMYGIFRLLAPKFKLERDAECIFATTPLNSNIMLFMSPFFYLSYGDPGLTRLILYDIGNSFTIFLVMQPIYRYANQGKNNFLTGIKMVFRSVLIWAFFLGIIFAYFQLTIPGFLEEPLRIIKQVNIFLPMFLLGIYFRPSVEKLRLVSFTVIFRALLGIAIGLGVSLLFPDPMDKVTIIMCAAAPIGVMGLIFASEYKRDIAFSSSIVSYSMLIGLVVTFTLDAIFRTIGLI